VHVREDGEHRPPGGEARELVEQDREGAFPLPLRRKVERRVAPVRRDREQRRQQRGGLADVVDACRSSVSSLASLVSASSSRANPAARSRNPITGQSGLPAW
jgi:hypothetical protein